MEAQLRYCASICKVVPHTAIFHFHWSLGTDVVRRFRAKPHAWPHIGHYLRHARPSVLLVQPPAHNLDLALSRSPLGLGPSNLARHSSLACIPAAWTTLHTRKYGIFPSALAEEWTSYKLGRAPSLKFLQAMIYPFAESHCTTGIPPTLASNTSKSQTHSSETCTNAQQLSGGNVVR